MAQILILCSVALCNHSPHVDSSCLKHCFRERRCCLWQCKGCCELFLCKRKGFQSLWRCIVHWLRLTWVHIDTCLVVFLHEMNKTMCNRDGKPEGFYVWGKQTGPPPLGAGQPPFPSFDSQEPRLSFCQHPKLLWNVKDFSQQSIFQFFWNPGHLETNKGGRRCPSAVLA